MEKLAASPVLARSTTPSSAPAAKAAPHDMVLAALLLLGRITESHLVPPHPDEAQARYEALLREHAGHPLANHAAVHLALLTAFPASDRDAPSAAERQSRLDALREAVSTPEARREIHSIQGRLHLDSADLRAALPHYRAARAIGHRQPDHDVDTDFTIANIARETGDPALAVAHYRAFLRARPRDTRAATVGRIVSELEAPVAAATPDTP